MLQVRRVTVIALLLLGLFAPLKAQDTSSPPPQPPLPTIPFGVINIASVDRLFNDTEFMFKMIDRPDVFDFFKSIVASNANDLKGIRRDQPLGVMFFLEPGLPPRPQAMLYMPVTSPEDFITTAALTGMQFEKSGLVDNLYNVKMRRGPAQQGLFHNGMLYLTPSEILLDGDLPDPVDMNKALSARYDIALSLRVKTVPALIRNVFVTYLRTSTEAQTQPRDNESEVEFRIRKANAISLLGIAEELLTQTDEITIGLDSNEDLRKAVVEINVLATPSSDYAKALLDMAGRPSMFHIAQTDTGKPLTVSFSWKMNKREKKASAEMVEAMRLQMVKDLTDRKKDIAPANTLCDALAATVEKEHFDAFVQVAVPEAGKFIVLGGVKLLGADAAGSALTNLLLSIEKDDNAVIETERESHQGVQFNRISGKQEENVKFIGGKPEFWLGSGQQAVWFAFGADKSFETLTNTMDDVLTSGPAPGGQSDPLVVILRRAAWQSLTPDPANRFESRRHELAEQAFDSTNDTFRVLTRPTENGVRTRLEFEAGFIRFLALFLASQYDKNFL